MDFWGLLEQHLPVIKLLVGFFFLSKWDAGASLKICVDDSDNISRISEIATSHGAKIGIVVEVNVGQDRCGVNTHQEAITLANKAMELNGVTFEGIQVC